MPSSYSPDLRLELPADGEQTGLWGQTTNRNLGTLIESAIAGATSVSVTTADQALTALNGADDQSRHAMLVLTTTTGANFAVYAPPTSKTYIVRNASSYTATIYNSTVLGNTTAAGAGVAVPAGKTLLVFSDGTDFRTIDAVNLTGTLAVANGGTGATDASGARTNLGLVIGTDVPSPTGIGASGTWNISILGNAATATSATNATNATNSTQLGGVAASGYQTALGFTPVQQSGAAGMGTNRIRIGWGTGGEGLRLVVDDVDFGTVWPITPDNTKLMAQIAANAAGGIGTYAILFSASSVTYSYDYAGSSLRAQGMARASDNVLVTPNGTGNLQTGTWKCLGSFSSGTGGLALFLRIA